MQIPDYLEPYVSFLKKYPYQCAAGAVASLMVLGLACWYFVPGTQAMAGALYGKGQAFLGVEHHNVIALGDSPSPNPTADPMKEQISELEKRMADLEVGQIDQKNMAAQVESNLKNAIAEVAKTNDILDKRQNEWLATLKRLSVATTATPTPAGKSTGVTGSPSSQSSVSLPSVSASSEPKPETIATPTSTKININLATVGELDALPGIGATYAQRIVDYRTQKGVFTKIDDIQNVSGIGPSIFSKIQQLITV